jgi:hypothetical protein
VTVSPTWPTTAGGVCQILGLLVIGHQLVVRGREAGRVGVVRRAGRVLWGGAVWLWARVRRQPTQDENRPGGQTVSLEGAIDVTVGVGAATLTTSVDERVELLGRQLHELGRHVDELADAARAELADEAALRADGDRHLEGQIAGHGEEHQRGERRMLGLDWTGFLLLVPGVVLTTWPVEIARWVNALLD